MIWIERGVSCDRQARHKGMAPAHTRFCVVGINATWNENQHYKWNYFRAFECSLWKCITKRQLEASRRVRVDSVSILVGGLRCGHRSHLGLAFVGAIAGNSVEWVLPQSRWNVLRFGGGRPFDHASWWARAPQGCESRKYAVAKNENDGQGGPGGGIGRARFNVHRNIPL